MYKLGSVEPEWVEILPGVKMQFAPLTRAISNVGRKAMRKLVESPDVDEDAIDDVGEVFSRAILEKAVIGWTGIGDVKGKAVPFSSEALSHILNDDALFQAAERHYVLPIILRDREKNVSPPASGGTGTKGTRARTTATSPARAVKAKGAINAPIVKTNPKATKAK